MGVPGDAVTIAGSADVDPRATIGDGSTIWHLAQVREGAVLGTRLHRRAGGPTSARG